MNEQLLTGWVVIWRRPDATYPSMTSNLPDEECARMQEKNLRKDGWEVLAVCKESDLPKLPHFLSWLENTSEKRLLSTDGEDLIYETEGDAQLDITVVATCYNGENVLGEVFRRKQVAKTMALRWNLHNDLVEVCRAALPAYDTALEIGKGSLSGKVIDKMRDVLAQV